MIKLTYAEFKNPAFEASLKKFCDTVFDSKDSFYNACKIWRRFNKISKEAQEKWDGLIKEYALKDDKGAIVPLAADKPFTFQVPADKQGEWKAACEAFNAFEVELDCHPITVEEIKEAQLSPIEVAELYMLKG